MYIEPLIEGFTREITSWTRRSDFHFFTVSRCLVIDCSHLLHSLNLSLTTFSFSLTRFIGYTELSFLSTAPHFCSQNWCVAHIVFFLIAQVFIIFFFTRWIFHHRNEFPVRKATTFPQSLSTLISL